MLLLQYRDAVQLLSGQQALIEPVQRPLIAHRIAVAAGQEFFQHLFLITRVFALQTIGVEQRLQGRIGIAEHGADRLAGEVGGIDPGRPRSRSD